MVLIMLVGSGGSGDGGSGSGGGTGGREGRRESMWLVVVVVKGKQDHGSRKTHPRVQQYAF